MEIHLPDAFDFWYGSAVVVSRGPDQILMMWRAEVAPERLKTLTGNVARQSSLSLSDAQEMALGTVRPTPAQIGGTGAFNVPEYLAEWLPEDGRLYFRGGEEEIIIRKTSCLCDDPSCRKCLQVTCRDQECPVHKTSAKAKFRKPEPEVVYTPVSGPEAEERLHRAYDLLFDAVDRELEL